MNGDAVRNQSSSRRHRDMLPVHERPMNYDEVVATGVDPPPLKLKDRVVWLSDNGPEFGYVEWLGKLPDVGEDWMAGVDFDNPVGSGTGLYNEHQLFTASMNHASLVPVIGLMKAEDFGGEDPAIHSSSQVVVHLPQKPSRNKTSSTSSSSPSSKNNWGSTRDPPAPSPASSTSSTSNNIKNLQQILADATLSESSSPSRDFVSGKSNFSRSSPTPAGLHSSSSHLHDNRNPSFLEEESDQLLSSKDSNKQRVTGPVHFNGTSTTSPSDLDLESLVEVTVDDIPRFGVIKWIGFLDGEDSDVHVAGIELEEECSGCCDGSWNGRQYFICGPRKGLFIPLKECKKDSRFDLERRKSAAFGSIDCPPVTGDIAPLSTPEDLESLCGKNRGIQGHHNSCYLDATLFAMFSCSTVFESLLHRPATKKDIPEYTEVQRVLKEDIVNPLRANLYVRADRVMHLRTLLEKLSSVRGLTSEEKDPEEFLNLLLNEILKADPYLKLSSGLESFFYQLFVEKDESLPLPTVQQLFDQSFLASDIKLREVPPALLIQMPRFGRQFKMYSRIIPSLYLDITDVLENSPRECCVCRRMAEYECKQCFGELGEGLDSTAFCLKCLDKSHAHKKRSKHELTRLSVPTEFQMLKDHTQVPRVYMELFAVLCIETSHYVAFVKCGSGPDAPWCFFDSMADRKGMTNIDFSLLQSLSSRLSSRMNKTEMCPA